MLVFSCQGRASCSLRADREAFLAYNMCSGVVTYLFVQFFCQPSQSTALLYCDSSLVRRRTSPNSEMVGDRVRVRGSYMVMNNHKLRLWLWHPQAKADRNLTKFGSASSH